MTADQLKRLEELCEMWANPGMKNYDDEDVYAPVMDMLPDIIEELKPLKGDMHLICNAQQKQIERLLEERDTLRLVLDSYKMQGVSISNTFTPPNDSHAK